MLLRAVAITLAVYAVIFALALLALDLLAPVGIGWLDAGIDILSGLGLLVLMVVLFPTAAGVFIGLYLDDVAQAVEARHYPEAPGRELPFWPALGLAVRFAALVLALNLLALPFYVLLIWFPPGNLLLFYGLNGYLLGREYFELVAWRHVSRPAAARMRRAHRGRILLAGMLTAFLLTIPLVNLLVPLLATAAMVHIFKSLRLSS